MLIAVLGYGSHWLVFTAHLLLQDQLLFQLYLSMVWVLYVLAIVKDPGTPPENYSPPPGLWRRWCRKCSAYKPPRAHHCKTCGRCVLKMDHHCPWTANCVGHGNFPHFLRFLAWVVFTTAFVLVQLSKRAVNYYQERNLPAYLVSKTEMAAVAFLLPLDFFVLATVGILLVRCVVNMIRGNTQIEVWEKERIEAQWYSERMWRRIRNNYSSFNGSPMPVLTSWSASSYRLGDIPPENDSLEVPNHYTPDDLVFPYDMGVSSNAVDACGYPWTWILPWGGPRGNGYIFAINDDDDQIGLPWPPDGSHQEKGPAAEPQDGDDEAEDGEGTEMDVFDPENSHKPVLVTELRKRLDPRLNLARTEWMNDLGETLDDFGVDVDAEH